MLFATYVKHAANLSARAPSNENTITGDVHPRVEHRRNLLSPFSSRLVPPPPREFVLPDGPEDPTVKVAYRKLLDSVINFPSGCGGGRKGDGRAGL